MPIRISLVSLIASFALPVAADPTVFAAASTGQAIDAVIAASGLPALTSYGASGTLARQIEQGAPADLFISANPDWMAYLADQGLVSDTEVVTLMSNQLVLIAPEGSAPFSEGEEIAKRLKGDYFVMADPAVAPVGKYGKAALEDLGLWSSVEPVLVPTRNTLATVAAVARGEAALGLVYASDAADIPGVEVVWTVPKDSHPPILYLAAPLSQGDDAEGGAELLAFLASDEGQSILAQHGFFPLPQSVEDPS